MLRTILSIIKSFSPKEFAVFIATASITLLSGVLLLIQLVHAYTIAVPADGGTFTEGIVGQAAYLNPILAREGSADRDVSSLLFASAQDLADDVKHNDAFTSWNMRIKEGAAWQDGSPVTSDDIVFTVQLIQNPDTASPLAANWQHVTANRVSEREVRFDTINAYALFPNLLRELRPIPKKYFADLSPANIRLSAYNLQPVGSGPFEFKELEKRSDGFITRISLKKNSSYGAIQSPPHLDAFELWFFENEEALVHAFNRGEIDGFGLLYPSALDSIELNAHITDVPTSRYYALFFNPNANAALASRNVRKALQLFIHKEDIAKNSFTGHARPQNGPLPAYWEWQPDTAQPATGDPEQAKTLLQEDGWSFDEETRTWNKSTKDGVLRLAFDMKIPETPALVSVAEQIRAQWEQEGISVTVEKTDPAQFSDSVLKTRDYQMILYGNVLLDQPDLTSFWHSNERFYPGLNFSLFQNAAVDSLLGELKTISPDSDLRKEKLNQLTQIILDQQPAAFLVSPQYVYVTRTGSVGISISHIATPDDRFASVRDWHVKTKRVSR